MTSTDGKIIDRLIKVIAKQTLQISSQMSVLEKHSEELSIHLDLVKNFQWRISSLEDRVAAMAIDFDDDLDEEYNV